jgi:hypothetical protein
VAMSQNGTVPEKPPQVAEGEEWAYRARATDQVVLVRVVRIGTARPPRVLVHFGDDRFEGREEWVPPNRLKVLWAGVAAWQAREDRWEAVRDASYQVYDTPEYWAVDMIFDALPDLDLHQGYGQNAGLLLVQDVGRLLERLDLDRPDLEDPLAFTDDDGTFVAPWPVTELVARRAAPLVASEALKEVGRSEEKARREAVYGSYHEGSRGSDGWYSRPEICIEINERYQPAYDLVRQWCGEEAVDRYDELEALRAEVLRLGQIAERAIRELDAQGGSRAAEKLRRELGIPVELLRASEDHQSHRR